MVNFGQGRGKPGRPPMPVGGHWGVASQAWREQREILWLQAPPCPRGTCERSPRGSNNFVQGFPSGSDDKESACRAGDPGSIPGSGRSPGEGNDYPLQYSCLENPHEQRSLVGYSPWDHKESNRTERLSLSLPSSPRPPHPHPQCLGEGKGIGFGLIPSADISHQCPDIHPLLFRVFSSPSTAHSPQCACLPLTEPVFWYVRTCMCVCACVCVHMHGLVGRCTCGGKDDVRPAGGCRGSLQRAGSVGESA
ncbi:unnamed protein product [Rangifer tarandus platyrhynchus]|uniref:Uncharacterized protein n=1 Tax=Rangifer tarandus platyrhynchus TaxID=3082113 RepID=A0AC59YXX2_RANTA